MMSNARRNRLAPRVAFLAALLSLSACSGGAMLGQFPEKVGGLPESAPQRPAETMPYPNVYEPRPTRTAKPLTDEEQKKLESELSNLRDSQNKRANPPPAPPPKEASKAAKEGTKQATKTAPKAPLKKIADKAKPKAVDPPEKKNDDSLVPDRKGPSSLKPIN
jgi:hypothetical protein